MFEFSSRMNFCNKKKCSTYQYSINSKIEKATISIFFSIQTQRVLMCTYVRNYWSKPLVEIFPPLFEFYSILTSNELCRGGSSQPIRIETVWQVFSYKAKHCTKHEVLNYNKSSTSTTIGFICNPLKKMQNLFFLTTILVVFLLIANLDNVQAGKKKKKTKSKKTKMTPEEVLKQDQGLFDSKTLKCLVCKNVIDEFEAAIYKVDPKKMVDTGTFRLNENGEQKRQVVSTYAIFCIF